MIKKVVHVQRLNDPYVPSIRDDLAYWLEKSSQERLDAVEFLRRQAHGNTIRLQRSVQISKRS